VRIYHKELNSFDTLRALTPRFRIRYPPAEEQEESITFNGSVCVDIHQTLLHEKFAKPNKAVDLSSKELTEIPNISNTWTKENVQQIDLSSNNIQHTPVQLPYKGLLVLKIQANACPIWLPDSFFTLAVHLQRIYLSRNRMKRLPCSLGILRYLKELDVSHNEIQLWTFTQLDSLELLDLSYNKPLREESLLSLARLNGLTDLNLNACGLTHSPIPDCLSHIAQLHL